MDEAAFLSLLEQHRLFGVVRERAGRPAAEACRLLIEGGIRVLEVTLDSTDAIGSIRAIRRSFSDAVCGAGTVLDDRAARTALDAGAQFLVTPALRRAVAKVAAEAGVPLVQGAMTPTEILEAHEAGCAACKVFPAVSLGPQYFRQVLAPLPNVPLVAVGGITAANAAEFLAAGATAVAAGASLLADAERGSEGIRPWFDAISSRT